MFEPRGHDMMSGPSSIRQPADCDIAILFIETSGCLPMCGHGTIGTVTMAIEHGLVAPKTPGVLRLDTPAGLVVAEYRQEGQYVEEVRITNVPAYVHSRGLTAECPGLGEITVDAAYGGNFYAIVEPQERYRDCRLHRGHSSHERALARALNENTVPIPRNGDPRFSHISGPARRSTASARRNALFYATRRLTDRLRHGTSARIANWAHGKLKSATT